MTRGCMSSRALRSFIRETINEEFPAVHIFERDLGSEREIQDYKKEKSAGMIPLSAKDIPTKNIVDLRIGEMGSFVQGSEPDFVVIAQNPATKKVAITRHSKSAQDVTALDFEQRLYAIPIMPSSPILSDILKGVPPEESAEGYVGDANVKMWYVLPKDKDVLQSQSSATSNVENMIGNGYYLLDQDARFIEPRKVYTSKFRQSVENFGCELTFKKSCEIIKEYDVNSPEWALAAACFYEYANSLKYTAAGFLAGGGIGAALGALYGAIAYKHPLAAIPYAGIGFYKGGSWGIVSADALLRFPVLMWSWKTKRKTFFWANLIYIILIIGFNSLANYSSTVVKAAPGVALENAVKAVQAVGNVTTVPGISSILKGTNWKTLLAELITTMASSIFADAYMFGDKAQIIAFLENPGLLEGDLNESRTALINDLRTRFPDR